MAYSPILDEIKKFYSESKLVGSTNYFVRDGIINEPLYRHQKKRVLFVAKEHNIIPKGQYQERPDDGYVEWWNEHVHLQFSHRIAEWAFGIQNGFPSFSHTLDYQLKHEALKSIAFINVKKSGGSSISDMDVISEYIEQTRDLLLRQILEIDPTHIVTCFRSDRLAEQLLNITLQRPSHGAFGYGMWKETQVVNFFHPSSRKNKKFLYDQLAEAFNLCNQIIYC
ncbi:MAG: hypothetical protein BGO21_00745 [Dyadobacter sp. 50-39]|uniref:hypothetical protein n=1 Tax=Dyadobacter sp. 50-39 TaxID=1895756 RepID=UPI000960BFFE|nr:hypothetical protein [Dyadobacter sp. 50-39]OJV16214.1 MAG: hypothetical protein BGO21_00745 [Dyadobacter sp. 50-39]